MNYLFYLHYIFPLDKLEVRLLSHSLVAISVMLLFLGTSCAQFGFPRSTAADQLNSQTTTQDLPRPTQNASLPVPPALVDDEQVFAPVLMDSSQTQAATNSITALLSQTVTPKIGEAASTTIAANVSSTTPLSSLVVTNTDRYTQSISPLASGNREDSSKITADINSVSSSGHVTTVVSTTTVATVLSTTVLTTMAPVSLLPSATPLDIEHGDTNNSGGNWDSNGNSVEEVDEPNRVERTVTVPILMYHYLSIPPSDADIYRLDLSVTPDQFSKHLDAMLDAGYTTISLTELWNHLENGASLPPKPVILTFDDGYLDNYENAFPLLIQRGMTATFFVVTGFVEEGRSGYVNWQMVEEMYNAGMSIESHSTRHFSLKGRDDEFLIFEALRTKEIIEAKIGVRPRFVSYPAGEYDRNTIDIFRSAGYLMGVTTIQGSTHSNNNYFELRRVRVRGTTDEVALLELMELDW